ncbi:MAG: choice-of-anchor G family protein [Pseudolysinimonas sp.]
MFFTSHPRTTARAHNIGRRIGAAITVFTLGGAFALAGAGSANAVERPDGDYVSWAQAEFLSGSILGANLNTVASVEPAEAWNDGNDPTMTDKDPLAVKALDSVTVGTGDSVQVNTSGVQAGVLGQFASASADARSYAASGAVLDDGGVGIGEDVPLPGADTTIDFGGVIGDRFGANLTDLSLAIKAIAAEAEADGENAVGDYHLAGAVLELRSPAISDLTEKVNTALDSISSSLGVLDGDDGALVVDLNRLLTAIDPTLNLLGANANVTASINVGDLKALVQDLLTEQYGESGVTFNLETGAVSIDLATAVGGDLNNLPVNTELISGEVLGSILTNVAHRVATIADQVVDRVREALHDAKVELHAKVDLNVAQSPLVQKVCETVQSVIQVPTQILTHVSIQVPVIDGVVAQVVDGVPIVNGLPVVNGVISGLGGLLGGGHTVTWITQVVDKYVTQNVSQTVDELICHNNVTALPALKTSATIDISGTVDEFLDGAGVDATAKLKVLGIVNTELNLGAATDAIADTLTRGLFGSDGTISDLVEALDLGLVTPALEGLVDGDNAVGLGLADLLSIRVNVQELSDGTFTETAMRVTVLGGLGSGLGGVGGILGAARGADALAQVNLAAASVGPNVLNVEDPCVGDCGVGGETITPPPGGFGVGGNGGLLAMTGVSIALLIAIVLALLAAGAYLVRESYRNRHSATSAE